MITPEIVEAIALLKQIKERYYLDPKENEELFSAAQIVEYVLYRNELSDRSDSDMAAEAFISAARKHGDKHGYKTETFKCHDDYKKCYLQNSPATCLALLVLCVAQQFVPPISIGG